MGRESVYAFGYKPRPAAGTWFRCGECGLELMFLAGTSAWSRCFSCAGYLDFLPLPDRRRRTPRSWPHPAVVRRPAPVGGVPRIQIRDGLPIPVSVISGSR